MHGLHAGTSRVENSAQGLSCQLKFVHGINFKVKNGLTHAKVFIRDKASLFYITFTFAVSYKNEPTFL